MFCFPQGHKNTGQIAQKGVQILRFLSLISTSKNATVSDGQAIWGRGGRKYQFLACFSTSLSARTPSVGKRRGVPHSSVPDGPNSRMGTASSVRCRLRSFCRYAREPSAEHFLRRNRCSMAPQTLPGRRWCCWIRSSTFRGKKANRIPIIEKKILNQGFKFEIKRNLQN